MQFSLVQTVTMVADKQLNVDEDCFLSFLPQNITLSDFFLFSLYVCNLGNYSAVEQS